METIETVSYKGFTINVYREDTQTAENSHSTEVYGYELIDNDLYEVERVGGFYGNWKESGLIEDAKDLANKYINRKKQALKQ